MSNQGKTKGQMKEAELKIKPTVESIKTTYLHKITFYEEVIQFFIDNPNVEQAEICGVFVRRDRVLYFLEMQRTEEIGRIGEIVDNEEFVIYKNELLAIIERLKTLEIRSFQDVKLAWFRDELSSKDRMFVRMKDFLFAFTHLFVELI